MAKKRIIFSLDDQQDADILRWLEGHNNRSAAIRHAIRQAMQSVTVDGLAAQLAEVTATLEAVQAAVQDLSRRGSVPSATDDGAPKGDGVEESLPPEVLDNLDSLGEW